MRCFAGREFQGFEFWQDGSGLKGLDADGDQVSVVGRVEGQDRLSPIEGRAAQSLCFAARCCVRDENCVRDCGYELVAFLREVGCGATVLLLKARQQQQAALLDWGTPRGGDAHSLKGTRRADD